ncbi:unnamed protein product, partial [Auanema sp. JU1783]
LTHYVNKDLTDWDLFLPKVTFTLNSIPSSTTGISPFVVLFGRDCRMPLDSKIFPHSENTLPSERLENKIIDTFILEKLKKTALSNTIKYNDQNKVNERDIRVNDLVMIAVKNLQPGHKLRKSYDGPFKVVKVQGSAVQIRNHSDKLQDVHKDNLKLYSRLAADGTLIYNPPRDDTERHQLEGPGGARPRRTSP